MAGRRKEHRIYVKAVRRDPPDLYKLARALIALAEQDALEAQRAAEQAEAESEGSDED